MVPVAVPIVRSSTDPYRKLLVGDGLRILGPGDNLIDAIVRSLDDPKPFDAAPPAEFEISSEESYYVWATIDESGKIKFEPQMSEATAATIAKVKDRRAVDLANPQIGRDYELKLYTNMIKYYAREAREIESKREAEKLRVEISDLADRLKRNEATLKSELDKARRLNEEAAKVDRVSALLGLAATIANVITMVDRENRAEIEKSKTPAELKDALGRYLNDRLSKIDKIEMLLKTDNEQLGMRTERLHAICTQNGAPTMLDFRLRAPIEFGKGAEFQRPQTK